MRFLSSPYSIPQSSFLSQWGGGAQSSFLSQWGGGAQRCSWGACFIMFFGVSELLWPSLVGFLVTFWVLFLVTFWVLFLVTFWVLFLTIFWSVFRSSLLRRHLAGFATVYGPFFGVLGGIFWLLFLWVF
jgi:hypothetical protein